MCTTYGCTTFLSILSAIFLIAGIAALTGSFYFDEWATTENCTVRFRQESDCISPNNSIRFMSNDMRQQIYICLLGTLSLLFISLVFGIGTMFSTNCCDERRTKERAGCCLFVIPFLNVIASIFCLIMCLAVVILCIGSSHYGISLYLAVSGAGILFFTSLTHICCYSNMDNMDRIPGPNQTNYERLTNRSTHDEEAPIMDGSRGQ